MKRSTWVAASLITLALAVPAWSQTSQTGSLDLASLLQTVLTGNGGAAATGQAIGVKKILRAELALIVDDVIQKLFRDMRTSLGLPAVPTDPATDPLSIFEAGITSFVQASLAK
jgi:hypothetical protein